jgi:hypothetical protein
MGFWAESRDLQTVRAGPVQTRAVHGLERSTVYGPVRFTRVGHRRFKFEKNQICPTVGPHGPNPTG